MHEFITPVKAKDQEKEFLEAFYKDISIVNDNYRLTNTSNQSVYVSRLPNMQVFGIQEPTGPWLNACISNAAGELLFEHVKQPINSRVYDAFNNPWPSEQIRLEGEVGFLVYSSLDNNYYHWLCHTLPRIYLYRQAGFSPRKFIVDLAAPGCTAVRMESLYALGITQEMLCPLSTTHIYQPDQLVSLPALDFCRIPSLAVLKWLRAELCLKHKIPVDPTYERLYISRKDALMRHVINEAEVEALLKRYNFKVVTLGELSLYRQIQLFASAKVLVAPHGAGLANIIFCEAGTKLLELMPTNRSDAMYKELALKGELNYMRLVCEAVPINNPPHLSNIVVDVEELERNLRLTLK